MAQSPFFASSRPPLNRKKVSVLNLSKTTFITLGRAVMIFRTEQDEDGLWGWHLRSTKLQRDIARCTSPVATKRECLERIEIIKLGVPAAVVRPPLEDS